MTPRHLKSKENTDWLLDLIRAAFAGMDGRIDPPSSVHRLTGNDIKQQAQTGEIWGIGHAACVFLTPKADALYLGKLAVAASARRKGYARRLVELSEDRARALGLQALELQTRVVLTDNHAVFRALGFKKTHETAHDGFDRPTSFTFRKTLD